MIHTIGQDCICNQIRARHRSIVCIYNQHVGLNKILEEGIVSEQFICVRDSNWNKPGEVLFKQKNGSSHAPHQRFTLSPIFVLFIHFQLIKVNQRTGNVCMGRIHQIVHRHIVYHCFEFVNNEPAKLFYICGRMVCSEKPPVDYGLRVPKIWHEFDDQR